MLERPELGLWRSNYRSDRSRGVCRRGRGRGYRSEAGRRSKWLGFLLSACGCSFMGGKPSVYEQSRRFRNCRKTGKLDGRIDPFGVMGVYCKPKRRKSQYGSIKREITTFFNTYSTVRARANPYW